MADPNIKTTAQGLVYYPIENVDPWWYIVNQTGAGTFDSIEQSLLWGRAMASVVCHPKGMFRLDPIANLVEWDSSVSFLFPGGGYFSETGPGSRTLNDGDWLYLNVGGYPITGGSSGSGYLQSGSSVPVSRNWIPVAWRNGEKLIFCGPDPRPNEDRVIVVPHGLDAVKNGTNLLLAMTAAAGMSPTSSAMVEVRVPPGEYNLGSQQLIINTDYVNVVGSGVARNNSAIGTKSVPATYIYGGNPSSVVRVSAGHTEVRGLRVLNTYTGHAIDASPGGGPNVDQRLLDIYAKVTDTTKAGIYGSTLAGYYQNCHSDNAMLQCDTFIGVADHCTGGDYSFGARNDMSSSPCSMVGVLSHCTAENYSFGYGEYGDGIFDGYAEFCRGKNYCFGASRNAAGDPSVEGSLGGEVVHCRAGTYSFGSGSDGKSSNGFTGLAVDCTADSFSFGGGPMGTFAGRAERCVSGPDSFGGSTLFGELIDCEWRQDGYKTISATARLIGCRTPTGQVNATYFFLTDSLTGGAHLEDCKFKASGVHVLEFSAAFNGPQVYDCTLVTAGVPDTISAIAPGTPGLVLHCRMSHGINANVVNGEAVPFNVVNPLVQLP